MSFEPYLARCWLSVIAIKPLKEKGFAVQIGNNIKTLQYIQVVYVAVVGR